MTATGTFEIQMDMQNDEIAPVGRIIIDKNYSGSMVGKGSGQMISKRTEDGASVYAAIEEFDGSIEDKKGSFTLFHRGIMSSSEMTLEILIVEGSGTGDFTHINGSLDIEQDDDKHLYTLEYEFLEN